MQKERPILYLLIIWTVLVYLRTLTNGFVYDDDIIIVNNVFIRHPESIGRIFSFDYLTLSGEGSYRPAVTITYMADYLIWGVNPAGYHLTNLLLHLSGVYSLYLFVLTLWGDKRLALISSAVFALNPIATEPVNAVSFREDLLIAPLCLFSLMAHRLSQVKGANMAPKGILKMAAPALYLLALLSKETAITLPLLAMVIDRYKDGAIRLRSYHGYLLVTVIFLYIRFSLFQTPDEHITLNAIAGIPLTFKELSLFIRLFFFPINLSADYAGPLFIKHCTILFLAAAGYLLFRSSTDRVNIPLSWLFISIMPALYILVARHQFAERYIYFPSIGLSIIMAHFLLRSGGKFSKSLLMGILLFYSLLAFQRNTVWRNDYTLWTDTVKKMPGSFIARSNIGLWAQREGRYDDAEREYKLALKINPNAAETHNNLAIAYRQQGRLEEAKNESRIALALKPALAEAYFNLGAAYAEEGVWQEASGYFKLAVKSNPYNANMRYNIGSQYYSHGEYYAAMEEFSSAVKLNPVFYEAHNDLGNAYFKQGLIDKAVAEYRYALRIKPDYAEAHNNLGSALFSQELIDEAIDEYGKAVKIKPNYVDAHFNLGLAYIRKGEKIEALREFRDILALEPGNKESQKIIQELSE